MPALHADERRDLPALEDPLDVVGGQRQLEGVGVLPHHAVDDVDLFERGGDRRLALQLGGDVDRPELPADAAGSRRAMSVMMRRLRLVDVELVEVALRVLAQRPRVVVVPVDERVRLCSARARSSSAASAGWLWIMRGRKSRQARVVFASRDSEIIALFGDSYSEPEESAAILTARWG